MHYCKKCARYFESARALEQHREASSRHTFDGSSSIPSPVMPPLAQVLRPGFSWPTGPVTQATRSTPRDDEPSKMLISSLTEYDHFALVFLPSLELAGANNILRLGSTPVGSTQTL